MNIKVEIKKILKGDKPTKAYANIVIDDAVVIHGVGVVENEKGRYMRNVNTPVTDESVLETLQGTVKMFIESCESTFINHPNILVSETNCQKAFGILDKAKEYINNLKEINNNAKNKSENNT